MDPLLLVHLSEEPMDVEVRCMLIEYLHSYFFIFVNASIDSSKTSISCTNNRSLRIITAQGQVGI